MFLERLKAPAWQVAYRRLPEGSILVDRKTPFIEIANQWPFCSVMDPFVFEHNGETYVFAEVYDSLKSRGCIGYSKWDGNSFSPWKAIIVEKYHLSYPFVYHDEKGDVHIVPESFQDKSVHSYRAVSFPDEWEREGNLISNVEYVDVTFVQTSDTLWAFAYDISVSPKELLMYQIKDGKFDLKTKQFLSNDDSVARPAGRFFKHHGAWVRVSQNCSRNYGNNLVFSEVTCGFKGHYSEKSIGTFSIEELRSMSNIEGEGTHTYNGTAHFEVVDIKRTRYSFVELMLKFKRGIGRLFH